MSLPNHDSNSITERYPSIETNNLTEHQENRNPSTPQQLHFGALNCNGLSGKAELLDRILVQHNFDFIFLSETWTGPGKTSRLSKNIVFPFEQQQKTGCRYNYGQCLLINPYKMNAEEITSIGCDQSQDRAYQVFLIRDILFCFVYFKPLASPDYLSGKIEEIEALCAGDRPLILAGDFNARSTHFGDRYSNPYGTRLIAESERLLLTRVILSGHQWTYEQNDQHSIVDHIFVNESARELLQSTQTRDDIFTGSDHYIISAVTNCINTRLEVNPPIRSWN